ncbi:MAG: flagellar biosynthetic protein FliO [Desulfobulbaceae bacterium]|nr:flagellar biosynthetic protein FliO [Desulfobulbaceae bacterium]
MNSLCAHIRPPFRPLLSFLPLLLLVAILLIGGYPASAADAPLPEEPPAVVATQPEPPPASVDALPTPPPATVNVPPTPLTPPTASTDVRPTPSLAIATLKAFGALAVVLGLLMLFAAALKKLGLSGQTPHGDGLIKVLETRMIAPKKFVAILDIAGQTLAVGITDQQISLLTTLTPDEKLLALARQPQPASRFASLLSRAVNNKNNIAQKDNA